jgi:phage tail tape-measure protein
MRIQASSLSSASTVSTSPTSKASAKRSSSRRCPGESGTVPPAGRSGAASSAARARCRALLTEASLDSSIAATSAAR